MKIRIVELSVVLENVCVCAVIVLRGDEELWLTESFAESLNLHSECKCSSCNMFSRVDLSTSVERCNVLLACEAVE
jgi:hypothetical protein